jgi:hypothetical protein
MGPAHPLVFDVHRSYKESAGFYRPHPSAGEMGQEAIPPEKLYSRLFVTDLAWTQPWGARICLKYLKKVRAGWLRGMGHYEKAVKGAAPSLRERVRKEFAVAKMVGCILTTAINTLAFHLQRDALFAATYKNSTALIRDVEEMKEIAVREIKNAEEALKALDMNYALGYFDIYGTTYCRQSIEEKIRQVRHVAEVELEEYLDHYLHHIFEENYDRKGVSF